MGRFLDATRGFAKRYAVYLGVLLALLLGFVHRRRLLRSRLEAKAGNTAERGRTATIIVNRNLQGKSIEEKRKYLLSNFDMDCAVGDVRARITIVDNSSFSCRYCKKMRPEIEKIIQEYVVDRKVARYALRPLYGVRDIPLGALLQCAKPENRLRMAEEFFKVDVEGIDDFTLFLTELGEKYGMDREYVKNCIHDEDLYRKIIYMQQNNREAFNINVTPLLVIENQEKVGYKSYEQIREIIENILSGGQK
ncbi:MAG: DsbA family protein [Rickettsiales bacterium]|jgi:thiol-disulfide isomerase/thioredoxin|nr:DsbA family protein [Rickettsiales bacterium]